MKFWKYDTSKRDDDADDTSNMVAGLYLMYILGPIIAFILWILLSKFDRFIARWVSSWN